MEAKTQVPNFTVSLRGYDREEVDQYLDSLADALGHVDDAEEHNRRLQSHIARLNNRIKELEDRVRLDTPKTGAALGERIGSLLAEAEDAAAETIASAEARAAAVVAEAQQKVADAEETVRQAVARGEEQARRIETAARGEAEEIVSEAETRANLRTRQIEQWAEQVVSHTRAEEVRMLKEQQEKRKTAAAELEGLAKQRRAAVATLHELRNAIGAALGILGAGPGTGPVPSTLDESPVEPTEASPAEASAALAAPESDKATEPGSWHPSAGTGWQAESDFDVNPHEADETVLTNTAQGSDTLDITSNQPAVRLYEEVPITGEIELRDHAQSSEDPSTDVDEWISGGSKQLSES